MRGTRKKELSSRVALLACGLLLAAMQSIASQDGFPETVKTIEEMRLTKPIHVSLPRSTTHRSKDMRTLVVLAHIGMDGRVVKSKLQQASGAHHLDETVLLAMRDVQFKPCMVDGEPAEVSVVIPMHVPADDIDRSKF